MVKVAYCRANPLYGYDAMKIVTRAQLMALPSMTVFTLYSPVIVDGLFVKTSEPDSGVDFVEVDLQCGVALRNGREYDTPHYDMVNGVSIPYEPLETTCRNGLFDHDQLYKIFEKSDVETLIALLTECVK